ncbi:hypothetical protein [Rickettsia endosymbiont of Pantilius tunicatus]|uniref:hypothetical protein n=1 Tax=Rickettsia endosymbiont of Pantilius tunicatus TaxID=3066267 RepID=UPI00376F1B4C
MLLDKGANIKAVDDTGQTSILHLFNTWELDQNVVRDQKEHDKKVVEILELLKEKIFLSIALLFKIVIMK